LILKEIGKLGKVGGFDSRTQVNARCDNEYRNERFQARAARPPAARKTVTKYKVAAGDTLSIIAKAYRDQGIKVTSETDFKANPGLDPKSLKVGQKIFIPAPAK